MSALESRQANAQLRRLQVLLLLMILWNLLAILAELSFGSALMKVDGDKIGGYLAGKASMSGAALALMAVYLYGIVRNPLRHRGVIWTGVVEQGAAAFFAVYHFAADDIHAEGMVIPLVVALVLLALLLINMPVREPHP